MSDVLIRTVEKQAVIDASGRIIAPPQPEPATRPSGPHDGNHDARSPVTR